VTSTVGSTPLVAPVAVATQQPVAAKNKTSLDKDAFLKLLVAQMRYQDPSKPLDSSQFMAQTAQFTQVEKLEQMASDSTVALSLQQGLAASSMVGKSVTWVDADGGTHTGKVTSASFGGPAGSEPTVAVGGVDVRLSSVSKVAATP
jgi:flagellar basal-body rod modification protein FlgD